MLIHKGDGTEIYRGRLRRASCTDTRDIVCKLAYADHVIRRIAYEARIYAGALAPLQGSVVPACHGHFTGENGDERRRTSCLVLAYCGEPLQTPPRKGGQARLHNARERRDAPARRRRQAPRLGSEARRRRPRRYHRLHAGRGTRLQARVAAHCGAAGAAPDGAQVRRAVPPREGSDVLEAQCTSMPLAALEAYHPKAESSRALDAGARRQATNDGLEDDAFQLLEDRLMTGLHLQ
ncbi:hypothetical protein EVG20_g4979 [Dentipellis fragilis]|uniref:Protein kinase domain-containing protein n=1 Tax=Dentipellis fragilis TaxID=205917 RepID=A0A4Y9YU66_9AGAM|nr:hypothetical protein EVG20_g4979 [Dentipellis fragilis]